MHRVSFQAVLGTKASFKQLIQSTVQVVPGSRAKQSRNWGRSRPDSSLQSGRSRLVSAHCGRRGSKVARSSAYLSNSGIKSSLIAVWYRSSRI